MAQRRSVRQKRLLEEFGANIRRWRKVNGMSASSLAERAFVTRETLRNIEAGTGTPRLESLFAVLAIIGIADAIVTASDPYKNDAARPRIDEILGSGGSL
jgi:transcriptional regulator with XRE-family HTH domain